jgi:hypothetical protein
MAFHVGQKVVCVDDGNRPYVPRSPLTKGAVYTVATSDGRGIQIVEVTPPTRFTHFENYLFRPVQERKTDISVFTEILKNTKAPAQTSA